jgi:hypothetical protein
MKPSGGGDYGNRKKRKECCSARQICAIARSNCRSKGEVRIQAETSGKTRTRRENQGGPEGSADSRAQGCTRKTGASAREKAGDGRG